MTDYLDCEPAPAVRIFWRARKVAGVNAYRGVVETVEATAWSPASWPRGRFVSDVARVTRADAMADAEAAAREAARTGFVPTF
jgi:hypothetical protein